MHLRIISHSSKSRVLDETFFKGIFKLMPGHCFTFHKGELNIERYWEPTFDADESKSLDEFVDEIDDVMHDSVEHHKISDVEVGFIPSQWC